MGRGGDAGWLGSVWNALLGPLPTALSQQGIAVGAPAPRTTNLPCYPLFHSPACCHTTQSPPGPMCPAPASQQPQEGDSTAAPVHEEDDVTVAPLEYNCWADVTDSGACWGWRDPALAPGCGAGVGGGVGGRWVVCKLTASTDGRSTPCNSEANGGPPGAS